MILQTFIVPKRLAGENLYTVVGKMLPHVPDRCVRSAFSKRDVKMNGVRETRDASAIADAEVKVYLQPDCPLQLPEILYQDQRILIVYKPVGISCDTDAHGGPTIGEWVYQNAAVKLPSVPMACHRLDNQTDGLLILALDDETRSLMEQAFREHRIYKEYTCMVKGTPTPPQATMNAWLRKNAVTATVKILDRPFQDALPVCTEYRTLQAGEISRLLVTLHTGRTHQIRAHMAHIGHPLLGDDKYGDRDWNRVHKAKRLMLTATALRLDLQGELEYLNDKQFTIEPRF